jgi:hypothetical protein
MSTRHSTGAAPPSSAGSERLETPVNPNRIATRPGTRLLLGVDGVFEALLGVLLVLSPVTGLYSALQLPHPAARPVVVGFGLLLLPLLPILWRDSRSPRRPLVLALAGVNGAGALVLALWVLIWRGAFHPAGAAFVLAVAAILAVLAVLQARAALALT